MSWEYCKAFAFHWQALAFVAHIGSFEKKTGTHTHTHREREREREREEICFFWGLGKVNCLKIYNRWSFRNCNGHNGSQTDIIKGVRTGVWVLETEALSMSYCFPVNCDIELDN